MDSNIILHVVSDTQDAGILALTQVAIVLGSIGTILGAIALGLSKRGPKKKQVKTEHGTGKESGPNWDKL